MKTLKYNTVRQKKIIVSGRLFEKNSETRGRKTKIPRRFLKKNVKDFEKICSQ